MKHIKVVNKRSDPIFGTIPAYFMNESTDSQVICAFDGDRVCTPDCAACYSSSAGSFDDYYCARGDIQIGKVKDENS